MTDFHGSIRSLVFVSLLAAMVTTGCGKKNSPAQPAGGGGGGGGTLESFDTGTFTSGVFVHTFAAAGTYRYHCSVHGTQTSGMFGDVDCSTGMADSATVNLVGTSFSPATAHVKPGGYVKWVASGANHTVTRP